MKTLILNDFRYYFKNKTKLLLTILFILFFVGGIKLYDTLELKELREEAVYVKKKSFYFYELTETLKYEEMIKLAERSGKPIEYWQDYDNEDQLTEEIYGKGLPFESAFHIHNISAAYASTIYNDRMNLELTPYRLEILSSELELLNQLNDEDRLKTLDVIFKTKFSDEFEIDESLKQAHLEKERLSKLLDTLTPDDFNKYTLTNSNLTGKVFEGYYLMGILIFILILFYDLISKDFDNDSYRTLYSGPYKRSLIIKSKIAFSLIYTLICIVLGLFLAHLVLFFSKTVSYNVLSHRHGYILHPTIMNLEFLSPFKSSLSQIIVPVFVQSIVSVILGSLMITSFMLLIHYLSFKLKSSSSTLTLLSFLLLVLFFINMTEVKNLLAILVPLFAFSYSSILHGEAYVNVYLLILMSIVWIILITKFIFKDLDTMDLLGGDHND